MPAFVLSEEEQEAARGLPWACVVLYLALRRRMDFSTGRVGAIWGISWQALREELYQEPHRGIRQVYPHKESVRRLARWLERRGLLRFESNAASGRLIFRLPMAYISSVAQKKPDRETTGSTDMGRHREKTPKPDMGKSAKPDTHPGSVYIVTTTNILGVDAEGLIVPSSATPAETATWQNLMRLSGLNGQCQDVMDEFSGALAKGAIQKRTAYLARLIEKAQAGSFVLDKGKSIKSDRERARTSAEGSAQAQAGITSTPGRSVAGEAIRKRMGAKKTNFGAVGGGGV